MSCCSPNYRKTVNEQEEKINAKGRDTLPLSAKILLIAVALAALTAVILL
ncbi:hypothetical protein [Bacillus sp. B-jedd]|nr:hypothetical protein [Bacillus sp. B-jedd]CEG26487.1 hypothetical protein BN1002_01334 [Bacillus sp. B-jedd]